MDRAQRPLVSLATHGAGGLGGIGVLLEGGDSAVTQTPDMRELRVQRSAGSFECALVMAEGHDGVAGIMELVGKNLEVFPFGGETEEEALGNRRRADVRVAVGVGEVLRFVPDNPGIHGGDYSRTV